MNRLSTSTDDRIRKIIEAAYIEAAALEAAEAIMNSDEREGLGFCQLLWEAQKKILKNKYEIEWDSPMQSNYEMSA